MQNHDKIKIIPHFTNSVHYQDSFGLGYDQKVSLLDEKLSEDHNFELRKDSFMIHCTTIQN